MRHLSCAVTFLAVLSLNTIGCVPTNREPEIPQPPVVEHQQNLSHTITYRGETLAVIAKWYTGTSDNWKEIKKANPNLNPNRMNLGDVILIPERLVTRRSPLPRSAVKQRAPVVAPIKTAPVNEPVETLDTRAGEPVAVPPTKDDAGSKSTTHPDKIQTPEVKDDKAPAASAVDNAGDTAPEPFDMEAERQRLLKELLGETPG